MRIFITTTTRRSLSARAPWLSYAQSALRHTKPSWWIGDAHSIWISDLERQLPTPNAALAAALGLANNQLKEDE